MRQGKQPRARVAARIVGGVTAGVAVAALVVGGGAPAGAQAAPRPAPSPSVTSAPGLSVHLDLPGLLTVHVDLPPLGGLLGRGSASGPTRTPAAATPTGVPVSRTPAAPIATPTTRRTAEAAPRPVRPASTPTPRPRRSTDPGGANAGVDTGRTVRDTAPLTTPQKNKKVQERKLRTKVAEAFHRPLAPVAPIWMLVVVVGLCALGTFAVVRLAGRKDRAVT